MGYRKPMVLIIKKSQIGTIGSRGPPTYTLAMSPYFYVNELLVQSIRIPLGYPYRIQVCMGVFPEVLLRLYPSYRKSQPPKFFI